MKEALKWKYVKQTDDDREQDGKLCGPGKIPTLGEGECSNVGGLLFFCAPSMSHQRCLVLGSLKIDKILAHCMFQEEQRWGGDDDDHKLMAMLFFFEDSLDSGVRLERVFKEWGAAATWTKWKAIFGLLMSDYKSSIWHVLDLKLYMEQKCWLWWRSSSTYW